MLKNKLFQIIGGTVLLTVLAAGGYWIYLNQVNGGDTKASVMVAQTSPNITFSASPTTINVGNNEGTTISWSIDVPADVYMGVEDSYGGRVYDLAGTPSAMQHFEASSYYNTWFGANQFTGQKVQSGTYTIHMAVTTPTIGWIYRDIYVTVTGVQASISMTATPSSFTSTTGQTKVDWSINVPANIFMDVSGGPNYGDTVYYLVGSSNGGTQYFNAGSYYNTWTGMNQFTGKAVPTGSYKIHMAATSTTIGWLYKDVYVTVAAPATQLATPNLMNPASNAVFTKVNSVSMSWGTVSGASKYQIQVDCDNCTSTWGTWSDNVVTQNYYEIPLTNSVMANTNHQVRFRVRAGDNSNNFSSWSGYGYFTVNNATTTTTTPTNPYIISTPVITYPAENAVLTPTSTGARKVTLKWNAVAQPISYYELEFLCSRCTGISIKNGTSTSYAYTAPDNNQVRFRVRAVDGNNNVSNWSEYRDFNFTSSTTTTTPTTTTTTQTRSYSDINQALYRDAITFLSGRGILSGYADGTFKPLNTVNRAELLKTFLEASNVTDKPALNSFVGQTCFADVPPNEWYTKYVCYAKAKSIVLGYGDGTFRPAQTVTMAEAFKIALTSFNFSYKTTDPWYLGINAEVVGDRFFPENNDRPDLMAMRRDMVAELVTRMVLNQEGKIETYINNPGSVK